MNDIGKELIKLSAVLALFVIFIVGAYSLIHPAHESLATYSNGQSLRVYGPTGRHLFTGEVCGSELPYVTLCHIHGIAAGGHFTDAQQLVVDTRAQFLLVSTNTLNKLEKR